MSTRNGGYTFLELLIVSSILAIIATTSIVAFVRYQERQAVLTDALALANHLRRVQVSAAAVDVPAGCSNIRNYAVKMSSKSLTVAANCDSGEVPINSLSLQMTTGSYSASYNLIFDSRLVTATPLDIMLCGNHYLYKVSVSGTANVAQPSYQGGC